jgi:hypothetical protein
MESSFMVRESSDPVRGEHAVARHHQRQRIGAAGLSHGARG